MKTFSELSIGDTIIELRKNGNLLSTIDKYGNKFPQDMVKEFQVEVLKLVNDEILVFNQYRNDPIFKFDLGCNKYKIETSNYIYYSCFEAFKKDFKEFLRKQIFKKECSIIDFKIVTLNEIEEIKKTYFNILN